MPMALSTFPEITHSGVLDHSVGERIMHDRRGLHRVWPPPCESECCSGKRKGVEALLIAFAVTLNDKNKGRMLVNKKKKTPFW